MKGTVGEGREPGERGAAEHRDLGSVQPEHSLGQEGRPLERGNPAGGDGLWLSMLEDTVLLMDLEILEGNY